MKAVDMAGVKYGRLTGVERIGTKRGNALWKFKCDCGGELHATPAQVRSGNTASCGCLHKESIAETNRRSSTHGMTRTPTYSTWCCMRERCEKQDSKDFCRYGARGIKVCNEWHSFEKFLADMGERPLGTTLDRINNNGDYEPGNCRWATSKEQAINKRTTKTYEYEGEQLCVAEISLRCGIENKTLAYRLKSGWSIEDATSQASNHGNGWKFKRNRHGYQSQVTI